MKKIQSETKSSIKAQLFSMRPIELSDSPIIAQWHQNIDDISIFDRQVPVPINHIDVVTSIKSMISDQEKEKCRWFVTEDTKGVLVGMSGLETINLLHGHAVLPLFISAPWRRSGIGVRMACMMVDLAFKQLRLHRVSTVYRADNAPSEALLARLGFQAEGVSRESWFSQGKYLDLINAGILANDWYATRQELRSELSPNTIVELGSRTSSEWRWPSGN